MAPEKESMKKDQKRIPRFNAEALTQKHIKRQMEACYFKSHTEEDKKAYQHARNVYLFKLNRTKHLYLNAAVEDTHGDQRKLFGLLDSLTKEPGGNSMPPGSDASLAEGFAHFFFRIKLKLYANLFNPEDHLRVPFTFPNDLPKMPSFEPVNLSDVRQLLYKAKPTTCLSDTIPTRLLKTQLEAFSPLITKLINLSLTSGTFPCIWKSAIVKPLLKKIGLKNIFKNYRPVSNLNFISKLLESVVLLQIQEHLYNLNLLPQYQNSYQANFLTETLLLKLIDDILKGMESQEVTAFVALDLSAAFDMVNYDLLLVILRSHFGIDHIPLLWIKSYLSNRSFKVQVGSALLEPVNVPYAVHQGRLLGPVLFICYIATLENVIQDTSTSLLGYADDHTVYNSLLPKDEHLALNNLSVVTDRIRNWMRQSFLKINDSKSEIVI